MVSPTKEATLDASTTSADTVVHAATAPLQSPLMQAQALVRIGQGAVSDAAAIAHAKNSVLDELRHADERLWAVDGYDKPMTGLAYHALVFAMLSTIERTAVTQTVAEQRQARRDAVPAALRHGVMDRDVCVILEALDSYAQHLAAVELPSWADIARAKNHADRRRARNMRDLIARAL